MAARQGFGVSRLTGSHTFPYAKCFPPVCLGVVVSLASCPVANTLNYRLGVISSLGINCILPFFWSKQFENTGLNSLKNEVVLFTAFSKRENWHRGKLRVETFCVFVNHCLVQNIAVKTVMELMMYKLLCPVPHTHFRAHGFMTQRHEDPVNHVWRSWENPNEVTYGEHKGCCT